MTSSTHKLILNLTKSPCVKVPLDILMGTPFPALSRALGQEHVPVELYDLKADPPTGQQPYGFVVPCASL